MDPSLKYLLRLPLKERIFWLSVFQCLKTNGDMDQFDTTKLLGFKTLYRVRKGDLRLVYRKTEIDADVVRFGPHGDVYKFLKGYQE